MHLVIVDTAQVQPYIFGSNRLRENVGASHLVHLATGEWSFDAVAKVAPPHNIISIPDGALDPNKHIEDGSLAAEVLYAGGGNFVALFKEEGAARRFVRKLSQRALCQAPGLQLVVAGTSFDWDREALSAATKEAFRKLAEAKRARVPSAPLLGLGVTVMCQSTGLPAVGITPLINGDPDSSYPASAEVLAKWQVVEEANKRLMGMFQPGDNYCFPEQLDHLGRTSGDLSYIAVVHADGNGVGKQLMDIGEEEEYKTADQNRAYVNELRGFSQALQKAGEGALRHALQKVMDRLRQDGGARIVHKDANEKEITELVLRPVHEKQNGGPWYLPFRPLVFGGDDVTFVCDARLGISLAVSYLEEFQRQTANLPDGKGRATACAGIAMVKAHYPFSRAYELANKLCRNAKDYRRKMEMEGACLDWHFARSGLVGSIKDIREREYTVKEGSLTLLPVALDDGRPSPYRTWGAVRAGVDAFQGVSLDDVKEWAGRRNKVKALRDALREGPESVKWFLNRYGLQRLPKVGFEDFSMRGWSGKWCGYFDALEMMDWFIPLDGEQGGDADAPVPAASAQK